MNRFSIACKAFADGLSSKPTIAETREAYVASTKRALKSAEDDVSRLRTSLSSAEKRVAELQTKLEQLNKLPDEAFSVLLS